jgi:hypothetical protein
MSRPDGNLSVPRRGILREDFELDARRLRLKLKGRAAGFPAAVFSGPQQLLQKRVPAQQEPTKENHHAF